MIVVDKEKICFETHQHHKLKLKGFKTMPTYANTNASNETNRWIEYILCFRKIKSEEVYKKN